MPFFRHTIVRAAVFRLALPFALFVLPFALTSCGAVKAEQDASMEADVDAMIQVDAAVEVCAKSPCDLFEQCGCTEPQACDLDLEGLPAGDTECRDVAAAGRELDRCTRLEECDKGYLCGSGQCLRYCQDDEGCTVGSDSICVGLVNSGQGTGTVPNVRTCSKPCSPEGLNNNNNCPNNFACRIFRTNPPEGDEFNYTQCVLAGLGGNDSDCSANGNNDCRPGFICVNFGAEAGSLCRQTCPVGQASPCVTGGHVCREFGTPPEVNGVDYGFCGVAPGARSAASPTPNEPVAR